MTTEQLLAMASAFDILPPDPQRQRRGLGIMKVEARGNGAWAITGDYGVLNHDGEWEYEPSPSNRTEDFFKSCRWSSAMEAILFAQAHLKLYPLGYKPDEDAESTTPP